MLSPRHNRHLEQQRIVAELEEERALVAASKALVEKMEAKVRECLARVWVLRYR